MEKRERSSVELQSRLGIGASTELDGCCLQYGA